MPESNQYRFHTTSWSLVMSAGDSASPEARDALDSLCQTYWRPIYAFAREKRAERREALGAAGASARSKKAMSSLAPPAVRRIG